MERVAARATDAPHSAPCAHNTLPSHPTGILAHMPHTHTARHAGMAHEADGHEGSSGGGSSDGGNGAPVKDMPGA